MSWKPEKPKAFSLVRTSTEQIYGQSDDLDKLEKLKQKYQDRDIICEIVPSEYVS